MKTGYVDAAWAQEHHLLWYEDIGREDSGRAQCAARRHRATCGMTPKEISMRRPAVIAAALVATLFAVSVSAKLPAPSDEAKAKAADAAAKAAWTDKVGAYQLCLVQDRVAATYRASAKEAGQEAGPPVAMPSCADPGPFAARSAQAARASARTRRRAGDRRRAARRRRRN